MESVGQQRAGPVAIKERGLVHARLPILAVSPKGASLPARRPVRQEHSSEQKGGRLLPAESLVNGW